MERQRDREMRDFSFVFEIYNLYFSIFQDNYVVLLMNLSSINFDFSDDTRKKVQLYTRP